MGPLVLLLGAVVFVTWPSLDVVPMLVALGAGGLILPILLYPSSYTLWQAIDIVMRPVDADDFDVDTATTTSSTTTSKQQH